MMSYFIEAATKIIDEEGIEAVTIRKVADIAGYNSATLYNYFENIDHLIFFACMKYMKDYALDLPNYIKNSRNSLDKYILIWECFCYHSFNNPKIYYRIFFDKFTHSIEDAVSEYYSIFPEELGEQSEDVLSMLLKHNIYDRCIAALNSCVNENLVRKDDIDEINEMTLLVYQGLLSRILNNQVEYTPQEATKKIVSYIQNIINFYSNDKNKRTT
ncbi:HTH-type transcriptional regulator BetI [Alkalithermobacter paradoxus]|uniref:HTH-type transcriptional regulator BetI n=2 Tax=Alkalithermobacter paradoxus TaxID=29349 RepID=A0A1V4I4Q8_9FIRM|nr:HTH-type transcriptional regulator BetI [[Clostridium] thermoalcaliphilum]